MKLLIGFLISAACWGQSTGQNVVVFPVLAQTTYTAGATVNSALIQNIGQTNHLLVITATSVSGSNSLAVTLLGSVDGTNYTIISNSINDAGLQAGTIVNPGQTSVFKVTGYLSYPYLKAQIIISVGGSSSITLAGTYIGNSNPASVLADMFGSSGIQVNVGVLTSSASTQAYLGVTNGGKLTGYGYTLNIPAGATEFKLFCSTDSGSTSNQTLIDLKNPTAGIWIWPESLRPYFQCQKITGINALFYLLTGAGGGTFTLHYREE